MFALLFFVVKILSAFRGTHLLKKNLDERLTWQYFGRVLNISITHMLQRDRYVETALFLYSSFLLTDVGYGRMYCCFNLPWLQYNNILSKKLRKKSDLLSIHFPCQHAFKELWKQQHETRSNILISCLVFPPWSISLHDKFAA